MPLTPQARIGLIVGGVAAGVFVIVSGAVVALVVLPKLAARSAADREADARAKAVGLGDEEAARKGKQLADRPVSDGNAKDDESYVVGHRWWKKKPTAADLDRIVRLVIETPSNMVVIVSATGQAQVMDRVAHGNGQAWPDLPRPVLAVLLPTDRRPDRERVLRALRGQLDQAEYRTGPGR